MFGVLFDAVMWHYDIAEDHYSHYLPFVSLIQCSWSFQKTVRGRIGVHGDHVAWPAAEEPSHVLERVPTQHQLAAAHPAPEIPLLRNLVIQTTVQVSCLKREAVVKLLLSPFGWDLGRSPYVVMNSKLFSMNTLGQYYRIYMLVMFQFNNNDMK